MKMLILILKIILTISISILLYSFVAVPQPAIAYISQINLSVLTTAAAVVRNLKSAVTVLNSNQCAFCQLKSH